MYVALPPGPLHAFMLLCLNHTLLPEQLLSGTRQWPQIAFLLGLEFLPWLLNSLPEAATGKEIMFYYVTCEVSTYIGCEHVAVVSKEMCFLPYF
jgi:hypothetical protein